MNKKYQIFISSTYEDLQTQRKKVEDTILSMYHFPIGMEMFSAADEEQWEIIKDTIDSSDYYVLIIAHRYGSIISDGEDVGISYTEKEYRYAKEKKIPILAFIIDNSASLNINMIEQDSEKKEKLERFKQDVMTGRTVQWWTSEEDLATKVMNALNKQFNRGKRPGWIRADLFNIEKTQAELIEMSKRLRELEAENKELRKKIEIRKPELDVTINEQDKLEITYSEQKLNMIDAEYYPLTMEDVPLELRNVISQEELENYNKSLPSKIELEKYKEEYTLYQNAKNNPMAINLTVLNNGTIKAKDIHIEIEFPEEIVLYRKKDIEELEIPDRPLKGVNPIDRYIQDKYLDGFARIWNGNSIFSMSRKNDIASPIDVMNINAKNRDIFNEDNSISIRMKDLLNEYTWNVSDKYFIVPIRKGIFEVKCSLMCEEYCCTEEKIIQIKVS